MGNDVIYRKMESLRRCIERIESKRPENSEKLHNDFDLQDIIALNLERAIQISVDIAAIIISRLKKNIPATMGECFVVLAESKIISENTCKRLRKSVGFRNISVHEYEKIDWDIVYSIITENLQDFRHFVKYVLMYIES